MSPGTERDLLNNQKRIIRELKRIADALEIMAGTSGRISLADYVDAAVDAASLMQKEDVGE